MLKPVQAKIGGDFWFKSDLPVNEAVHSIYAKSASVIHDLDTNCLLLLDHALATDGIIPAYLGGLFGMSAAIAK